MEKAKIWKIGTKVQTYIYEFIDWMEEYDLSIGDLIFVSMTKKNNDVILKFKDDIYETYNKTKIQQLLKILLTINFIKPNNNQVFSNDGELLSSMNYKIISNEKNWRENFIDNLRQFTYIDEIDEDGEDKNSFVHSKHKDSIFSFLKAFEIYDDGDLNKYDLNEKKYLNFWFISELFNDFNNELRDISSKLIHKFTTPVKPLKDLSSIEWSDHKIKKLVDIKNDELSSKLWNLADILSLEENITIPIMQRKYVWTIDLVDKLLDDINSLGKERKFHYIGSIVYKMKENEFRVLDGQQRLTTLFLIITAIHSVYSSKEAEEANIKIPIYFKTLFKKWNSPNTNKLLKNKFKRLHGNSDYLDFLDILDEKENTLKDGVMWNNYNHIVEKITYLFKNKTSSNEKQDFLDKMFLNAIEKIAFTANKNQIESEYEVFEKLNTLSMPLTQIDLLKNYLLQFCKSEELDMHESDVQATFEKHILSKLKPEASIKRFINYYIALNSKKYLGKVKMDEDKNVNKSMKPFTKLSNIIKNKYNLQINSLNFDEFIRILIDFGEEISDFQSITNRSEYIKKNNKYHDYSDILASFDKRFVYAPLLKTIFDHRGSEKYKSNNIKDRSKINEIRDILFEIERYELFFQVVLYRGQSISGIIERVIDRLYEVEDELTAKKMREIFSDQKTMSSGLIIPNISSFRNKVANDPMPDKVSILILNRMKFYYNNGNSMKLNEDFGYSFLQNPSREHILSQEVESEEVKKEIYNNSKNTIDEMEFSHEEFNRKHNIYLEMIGNILMVEKSDNSSFSNKSSKYKLDFYKSKPYLEKDPTFIGFEKIKSNPLSLKTYLDMHELNFDEIKIRSEAIADKLIEIYE